MRRMKLVKLKFVKIHGLGNDCVTSRGDRAGALKIGGCATDVLGSVPMDWCCSPPETRLGDAYL